MEDDDQFLARHREMYARRLADIAKMPDMRRFAAREPEPQQQQPQLQSLIDGKPRFERTEEQERIRARGQAMLQIEEALAAEEASAAQAKADATANFKRDSAIGRLLR